MNKIRGDAQVFPIIYSETVSVISVESLESSDPEQASGILKHLADSVIGDAAVGTVDMHKRKVFL
jgi:hypothetical protein